MSARFDAALPTRAEFEKALAVADEGRERHGLYAVEDAQAILRPIAKFNWRHSTLSVLPAAAAVILWFSHPWHALLVVVAGLLIVRAIVFSPGTAGLFAPTGYTVTDVGRASSILMRTGIL